MFRYLIHLQPDALDDIDRMRKFAAVMVMDGIEKHLRFEPARESRSRIKKLRGDPPADYRLRIEGWRVFYNITGPEVRILRILHKSETQAFYDGEET